MKNVQDVTIVVCVADDLRIKLLLDSIYEYCEVVVVLNGATEEVRTIVNSYKLKNKFSLKVVEISKKNLSKSRDLGIENATNEKVIFYDSDCLVVRGAFEKFSAKLNEYLLVDGKVLFKKDTFQSKIVSYTREIGLPNYALCPAMGVNKKVKKLANGYFFDHEIFWCEDSELNNRAKKNNVEIGVIKDVTCIHDNLSFKQDLKSAYRYGCGVKFEAKKKMHVNRPTANWNLIKPIMKKNMLSGLYYILWNIVYCIGFYIPILV